MNHAFKAIASIAIFAAAGLAQAAGSGRAPSDDELLKKASPANQKSYASCRDAPFMDGLIRSCRALIEPEDPKAAKMAILVKKAKPAKPAAPAAQGAPNYFE